MADVNFGMNDVAADADFGLSDAPAPTSKPKRKVGAVEGGIRGLALPYAKTGDFLAMGAGGLGVVADAISNLFTGGNSTRLQDAAFSNLVDPARSAIKGYEIQPDEELSTGGMVANTAGNLAGIVQQALATGGSGAVSGTGNLVRAAIAAKAPVEAAKIAAPAALHAAAGVLPSFALPEATSRSQDLMEQGVDSDTALKAFATNAAANTALGVLPVGMAGNLVKRAITGGAVAAGTGALAREVESGVLGDQYQEQALPAFSADTSSLEGGIGAVVSALLGKRGGMARNSVAPEAEATMPMDAQQIVNNATVQPELSIADVISQFTGAPVSANPQEAIRGAIDANNLRRNTAKEIKQGELAQQVKLYGDDLPPQYNQAPITQEQAVASAYEAAGISPDASANAFSRARVADQMDLPESVSETKGKENTKQFAQTAFDIANLRQGRADGDLADTNTLAPDYQGGYAAATGGRMDNGGTTVYTVGRNQFEPIMDSKGQPSFDKKGAVHGTLTDADGNTTEGFVPRANIKETVVPNNQRLAQDFVSRSSEPKNGVGEGTMQGEKMPRRSTDRIAGDKIGGAATRNLADPYTPETRNPSGDVSVEAAPIPQGGLKQPRQGTTIDGEFSDASTASPQKQKMITAAQKVREAADGVEGKAKDDLIKQAEKIEKQAAKIKEPLIQPKTAKADEPAPVVKESLTTENADQFVEANKMVDGEPRQVATIGGKNSSETISVRANGDKMEVLYNNEPLIHFDTEVDVTVARGASIDDIKKAVKDSGQFGKKTIISYDKAYKANAESAPLKTQTVNEPVKTVEPEAKPAEAQAVEPTDATTTRVARVNEIRPVLEAWLPSMDWAVVGGRMIRDTDGNVTGRTIWTPIDPEFGALRDGLDTSFTNIKKANRKALDGLPLSKSEQRIVDATIRMHDHITKQSDEIQVELDAKKFTDDDVEGIDKALTDDDINSELRYAGYDERTSNTEASDFKPESEISRTEQNSANAETEGSRADEFSLKRESEADITRRESELKASQDKLKAEQKAFDDKKTADAARDTFSLSGSNRDADVAASKGQKDIFDTPAEPKPTRTSKAVDESLDLNDAVDDLNDANDYVRGNFGTLNAGVNPADVFKAFKSMADDATSPAAKNARQAFKDVFSAAKQSKGGLKERLAKIGSVAFIGEASALRMVGNARGSKAIEKVWAALSDMGGVEGVKTQTYEDATVARATSDINALAEALAPFKGNDLNADRVRKLLENRTAIDATKPLGKAAASIAKILDRTLRDLKDSGVVIGDTKDFFPHQYLPAKIANSKDDFIARAKKAYLFDAKKAADGLTDSQAQFMAESWYYESTTKHEGAVDSPFAQIASGKPTADFAKSRIISLSAFKHAGLEAFADNNVQGVLESYLRKTARRIEFEKRFGGVELNKDGSTKSSTAKYDAIIKELRDEGNSDLEAYVAKTIISATGQGRQSSAKVRAAVSIVGSIQTVQLLRRAVVSSLTEGVQAYNRSAPLQGQVKGATNALKAYGNVVFDLTQHLKLQPLTDFMGLKGVRLSRDENYRMAEMMGAIMNSHVMDSAHNNRFDDFTNLDAESNAVGKLANSLSNAAVSASGLRGLTNSNIVDATAVGRDLVREMAHQINNPQQNTKLAEYEAGRMGLSNDQAKSIDKYLKLGKSFDEMLSDKHGKNDDAINYFRAIDRVQKQIIAQATSADKPRLAKHPYLRLAFGFQGWMTKYWYNVQRANVKQIYAAVTNKEGFTAAQRASLAVTPIVATAITTAFATQILTAMRDLVAGRNQNEDYKEQQEAEVFGVPVKTWREFSQASAFGLADPFVNKVTSARYGADPVGSFGGALVGNASKVVRTGVDVLSDKNSDNTNTAERALATAGYNFAVDPALAILASISPAAPVATFASQRDEIRRAFVDGWAGEKKESNKKVNNNNL